ncbi:MAG: hypothetical protein PHX51_08375, partial [Clostridia bacterium]|nr:hypothetical protein [Clostridia bacterium]
MKKENVKKSSCTDCPFSAHDKLARKLPKEKLEEYYKKSRTADYYKQEIHNIKNKIYIGIDIPCATLKAVSFKCHTEVELASLINFVGKHFAEKKTYTTTERRTLLLVLKYMRKVT